MPIREDAWWGENRKVLVEKKQNQRDFDAAFDNQFDAWPNSECFGACELLLLCLLNEQQHNVTGKPYDAFVLLTTFYSSLFSVPVLKQGCPNCNNTVIADDTFSCPNLRVVINLDHILQCGLVWDQLVITKTCQIVTFGT